MISRMIPAPEAVQQPIELYGARYAKGPRENVSAMIRIAAGRIVDISAGHIRASVLPHAVDLGGYLLMPGLINAHDHLTFALFPRLGNPPYRNYIEWGEDIHRHFPDVIAKHKIIPKEVRAWWGGIRNLLCGVTTVSHHDPLWPMLQQKEFPVKVVQTNGWAHSPALGGDLLAARKSTPAGHAFIIHACEGVDDLAREELWHLDRIGLLDAATVLVHGLAIDASGLALMHSRKVSLIVCPSSNRFLFKRLPDMPLFAKIKRVALGSDSPLTAEGDLLDEARFAINHCRISPQDVYRMVTEVPAELLRLENGMGRVIAQGPGDLIAIRDTGQEAAVRLSQLSHWEIELVMIDGIVRLASKTIMERLPHSLKQGMEPLWVEGSVRWLRAPISRLLREAESVLGIDQVMLGGKLIHKLS